MRSTIQKIPAEAAMISQPAPILAMRIDQARSSMRSGTTRSNHCIVRRTLEPDAERPERVPSREQQRRHEPDQLRVDRLFSWREA
jgi:hypothetical protein